MFKLCFEEQLVRYGSNIAFTWSNLTLVTIKRGRRSEVLSETVEWAGHFCSIFSNESFLLRSRENLSSNCRSKHGASLIVQLFIVTGEKSDTDQWWRKFRQIKAWNTDIQLCDFPYNQKAYGHMTLKHRSSYDHQS